MKLTNVYCLVTLLLSKNIRHKVHPSLSLLGEGITNPFWLYLPPWNMVDVNVVHIWA